MTPVQGIADSLVVEARGELLRARLARTVSADDLAFLYPGYPKDAPTTLAAIYRPLPLRQLYAALPERVVYCSLTGFGK